LPHCILFTRDRPIYWPSRYIDRYLGFTDISVSANIIGSRYTCGSFGSTKSLTGTYGAEVQSMPSLAQINLKKLA